MPSQKNTAARQRAQAKYNSKPEQKKRRASRNAARREAIKSGKARKGDGKDIHHKDGNPLNNDPKNTASVSKKTNRSLVRDRNARKRRKNGK